MPKITKIESTVPTIMKRKRVAAYARVSVEKDRSLHSLSAQISHYNDFIQGNPDWEFVGVYADSGISATKTEGRDEFQRLISDCEKGLVDTILCKSISRFARNTVDLLDTVRKLKPLGVEVIFEKEGVNSMSADGEVMLSILASFAQEESRSLSENVKWGTRKRFEQGIPNGRNRVFGYQWVDEKLEIIPEEAKIVKRIYKNYLDGKSRLETAREFESEGKTTLFGCTWKDSNIKSVLTNITYTGNLLLQKEFITDPISKQRKKNRGELPQYFVENTHEAIISMENFQFVQEEMARRKELGAFANKSLNITCFTSKIQCSCCGKNYQSATSNKLSSPKSWQCASKKHGSKLFCESKGTMPENALKVACCKVLSMDEFMEEIFLEKVKKITAKPDKTLIFHLTDGDEKEITWVSTARIDCWTEERRKEWGKRLKGNTNAKGQVWTEERKQIHSANVKDAYRKKEEETNGTKKSNNDTCDPQPIQPDTE